MNDFQPWTPNKHWCRANAKNRHLSVKDSLFFCLSRLLCLLKRRARPHTTLSNLEPVPRILAMTTTKTNPDVEEESGGGGMSLILLLQREPEKVSHIESNSKKDKLPISCTSVDVAKYYKCSAIKSSFVRTERIFDIFYASFAIAKYIKDTIV